MFKELARLDIQFVSKLAQNNDLKEDLNYINDYYYCNVLDENLFPNNLTNLMTKSFNDLKCTRINKIKKKYINSIKNLNICYSDFTTFHNNIQYFYVLCNFFVLKAAIELNLSPFLVTDRNSSDLRHHSTSDSVANCAAKELEKFLLYIQNFDSSTINIDFEEIFLAMKGFVEYCFEKNFFIKKTVKKKNKTINIVCLNFTLTSFKILPKIFYKKFKYFHVNNQTWIYTDHYSTLQSVFKKNYFSDATFIIRDIEYKNRFLNNLCELWAFIDLKLLKEILQDNLTYYNFKESELEKVYIDTNNLISLTPFYKSASLAELSKKASILYKLIKIKNICDNYKKDQKIYFPFTIEFRGRLFFESDVSPTYNNEFRYCLHQGEYTNLKSRPHILNDLITDITNTSIEKVSSANVEIKNFFKNFKNKTVKQCVAWLLISLAETEKTQLNAKVTMDEFIVKGFEIYKNNTLNNENIKIFLKKKYLIYCINEIKSKIYIKRFISKDATASMFQHLIKILGPNNSESIKWCNLNSKDTWYDTYKFIISEAFKNINYNHLSTEEFNKIFNRDNLKSVIMTESYGAVEWACWSKLKDKIKFSNYNQQQQKEIEKIFKYFFGYLTSTNNLTKHSSKTISNIIFKRVQWNKNSFVFNDSGETNFCYNIVEINSKEIRVNKKRKPAQRPFITLAINSKKIKISSRANYTHSLDACLVRWIITETPMLTIHDCFLIDWVNIVYLISKINEGMRISFHDLNLDTTININEIFSPFIIL